MDGCDLKSLLPTLVSGIEQIAAILDAISHQCDSLELAAYEESLQLAANTATHRLEDWEKELGLICRADLPYSERKAQVLAALGMFEPCTKEGLTALFSRLIGAEAAYDETPAEYRISMDAQTPGRVPPDLPGIAQMIYKKAPAHLECALSATGDMTSVCAPSNALYGGTILQVYAI